MVSCSKDDDEEKIRTRLFSLHRGSYLLYVSSDSVTILLNDNIVKSGCQVDFCIPVHMPPCKRNKG